MKKVKPESGLKIIVIICRNYQGEFAVTTRRAGTTPTFIAVSLVPNVVPGTQCKWEIY